MDELSGFAVSEEQCSRLQTCLTDLAVQAEADFAFLCDNGGNILAFQSDVDDSVLRTIAALGAGSFAATRELAGLLGETEFQSVQHRAAENGIYMHIVAKHFLIIVIFGKETTAGLVKLYVEKAVEELEPLLHKIADQTVDSVQQEGHIFEMDTAADPFGSINAAASEAGG